MVTASPIPAHIETVFTEFRTAELATVAKDGTPITWAVTVYYKRDAGQFFAAASAGLAAKALNIRRNPKVSLLFSEPVGSGLIDPPAVLVQGNAESPDTVITSLRQSDDYLQLARIIAQRQKSDLALPKFLSRRLLDWYYIRVPIYITIERVLWWANMDFTQQPQRLEVTDVG